MSSDSGEKKPPITATAKNHHHNNHHVKQEPEQHLPCPRCDSINTKFCYYNNYNFSQPRHFCKSCRRYWTHGGTLRDIPVGGATRKNAKRSRLSTAPVSSTSISTNNLLIPFTRDHSISGGSFSSLLSTSQNHHHGFFGFDQDLSFGVGRTFWPFNGGHAAVGGGGITWQMEIGGDGGGDSFVLPELAISTQGNAMRSTIN